MYTFDSRIRYSEVGQDGRLTTEALIDYFQDCSGFQSEDLEIGVAYLREHGIAWVVNYWQIELFRRPALGDHVQIGTAPYDFIHFMGMRNFSMKTGDGEMLACANSVWSLIDLAKGMPVEVPTIMRERYTLEEKLDMEYLPRKIKLPGENGTEREKITVASYHLDTNHHVNNGQYVRMAMGALPEQSRLQNQELRRLRVEYRKQALLGDTIVPVLWEKEETITVALNGRDGKPYAVVEMQLGDR